MPIFGVIFLILMFWNLRLVVLLYFRIWAIWYPRYSEYRKNCKLTCWYISKEFTFTQPPKHQQFTRYHPSKLMNVSSCDLLPSAVKELATTRGVLNRIQQILQNYNFFQVSRLLSARFLLRSHVCALSEIIYNLIYKTFPPPSHPLHWMVITVLYILCLLSSLI